MRVLNLGDNTDKVKPMNLILKIYKKIESKIKVIAVGDNFNDLDMLKNCDIHVWYLMINLNKIK